MNPVIKGHRTVTKKLIPILVVLITSLVVVANSYNGFQVGRASFVFDPYWPAPASYTPGTLPPTAYLQINYTGPGVGSYSYLVTYNSTSGTAVAANGTALVAQGAPFRAYVYIAIPANGVVVAHVVVFGTLTHDGHVMYSKDIGL